MQEKPSCFKKIFSGRRRETVVVCPFFAPRNRVICPVPFPAGPLPGFPLPGRKEARCRGRTAPFLRGDSGQCWFIQKGRGRFAEELAIFIVDYSQKQSTGGFPRQSEDCLGMTGNRGLVRNDSVYFVDTLSKKRAAFAAL